VGEAEDISFAVFSLLSPPLSLASTFFYFLLSPLPSCFLNLPRPPLGEEGSAW